jgi:hypothetical protein
MPSENRIPPKEDYQEYQMKFPFTISAIATALLVTCGAHANVINVFTPSGSTDNKNEPVNASAKFTTGAGFVTITLSDLLPNPTSAGQLVSDISFALTTGQTSGTLGANSGIEITVASDKSFKLGSSVSTGWGLTTTSSGLFELSALGTAITPAHLIIGGPGAGLHYTSANASIAGNGPHNPFLAGVATFTLDITGVTAATGVTGVNFSFGTEAGDNVAGVQVPDGGTTVVLLGVALSGLGLFRRKLA